MRNLNCSYKVELEPICDQVEAIFDLVSDADDLGAAAHELSALASNQGLSLLFYGLYHKAGERRPRVLHTRIPSGMLNLCENYDERIGCPAIQRARRTPDLFWALSYDYVEECGFTGKRYLKELRGLGHDDIAVIPVEVHDVVHVFFIGVSPKNFGPELGAYLQNLMCQFVAATAQKFPEWADYYAQHQRVPENPRLGLSAIEVDCLLLSAKGKSRAQIATLIGLSEHTVERYQYSVCARLGAENLVHALTKALQMKLFPVSQLLEMDGAVWQADRRLIR